jgi:hypothetical protein
VILIEARAFYACGVQQPPASKASSLKLIGDIRTRLEHSNDDLAALMVGIVTVIIEGCNSCGAFKDRDEGYVAKLYEAVELAWRIADASLRGSLAGTEHAPGWSKTLSRPIAVAEVLT